VGRACDELTPDGFLSNHAGGILVDLHRQDIVVTIGIKPTSSIRIPRKSIDKQGNSVMVETNGRHDPCVGIRATPIAEAMLALVSWTMRCCIGKNADVTTTTRRFPVPKRQRRRHRLSNLSLRSICVSADARFLFSMRNSFDDSVLAGGGDNHATPDLMFAGYQLRGVQTKGGKPTFANSSGDWCS